MFYPTTDWKLKVRSLVKVSEGVIPFNLQLLCTASALTSPSIEWHVYQTKRRIWENVRDDAEAGVRIEKSAVSSCVLTSILTVTNYRQRGYSGSVVMCSASTTPGTSASHSANFTVPGIIEVLI